MAILGQMVGLRPLGTLTWPFPCLSTRAVVTIRAAGSFVALSDGVVVSR